MAEDTEEGAVGMGGWGRGRASLPVGVKVRVEEPGRGGRIFLDITLSSSVCMSVKCQISRL